MSQESQSLEQTEQKGAEPGKGKDVEQQGGLTEARTMNVRVVAACTKLQVPPTHKLGGGGGVQEESLEAGCMNAAKAPKGIRTRVPQMCCSFLDH